MMEKPITMEEGQGGKTTEDDGRVRDRANYLLLRKSVTSKADGGLHSEAVYNSMAELRINVNEKTVDVIVDCYHDADSFEKREKKVAGETIVVHLTPRPEDFDAFVIQYHNLIGQLNQAILAEVMGRVEELSDAEILTPR